MSTVNAAADARTVYAQRADAHAAAQGRFAAISRRVSYARVAAFLSGAGCLLTAVSAQHAPTWLYPAGAAGIATFVVLVVYHSGVERQERQHGALRKINEDGLARLRRDWAHLPVATISAPAAHPYAEDLDVFGRASLFTLLWNGGTQPGRERLADWLLRPASPHEVRARQQAVAELAPLVDLRQRMVATAVAGAVESHAIDRFLEWAEGPAWLSRHPLGAWAIRALTLAIAFTAILQLAGATGRMYWLPLVVVAFIVSNLYALRIEAILERAFAHHAVFGHYADLFALVLSTKFEAPLLHDLQARMAAGRHTAEDEMKALHRLMEMGDLRRSALLHLPVQIFTLWDFHVVLLVERWQRRAGRSSRAWFDALATFEGLAALATLRFDNPSWAFPDVDESDDRVLEAMELGHPLLPAEARVDNDVSVGPPGTFLLVTGSNMSGKSTLLRAIGVNVVLAQAGAPVCAVRLRLPAVRLYTSMRVQDSLEQGVSFFMAAVRRLKQVVEAAGPSPLLLYLLDEVLQGTNTAERQIAVRSILRHLLARPAIGAVTTHDLSLAATPDLSAAARLVHFTEQLQAAADGAAMTFDYRLRPGLATSRNALRLMQMVGLEVEDRQEIADRRPEAGDPGGR